MNLRNQHKVFAYLFIVLLSTSMTLFTLHSHHHIQWNHPQKQAQTGTTITIDSSTCPISGYLFGAQFEPIFHLEHHFVHYQLIQQTDTQIISKAFFAPVSGRSPPFC